MADTPSAASLQEFEEEIESIVNEYENELMTVINDELESGSDPAEVKRAVNKATGGMLDDEMEQEEYPVECVLCGKVGKTEEDLEQHMELMHNG